MVVVLLLAVPVAAIALVRSDQGSAGGAAASSTSTASDIALVIRHQTKHCHAWSYNGNAYAADQTARLIAGDSITVTNNDVMGHKLVEISGPAATITTPAMDTMGATSTVTFPKSGTYVLGTKPGEDYHSGVVTVGEDNVLQMKVNVS